MWLKKTDGDYVNSETGVIIETVDATGAGAWRIRITGGLLNAGPYANQGLAQAAAQKLVAGIDPSLFI